MVRLVGLAIDPRVLKGSPLSIETFGAGIGSGGLHFVAWWSRDAVLRCDHPIDAERRRPLGSGSLDFP